WEVHLLAGLGYDTGDELKVLNDGIRGGYSFDQVVLVYCLNDISDIVPEWAKIKERIYRDSSEPGLLRENSYFVDMICTRIKARTDPDMKNYFEFVLGAYRGPLWEDQKQRLRALRALVESQGGHLSVVTFPFMHAIGSKYEYQFVHDQLDQLWRELKMPHLDLLLIYKDMPPEKITVNRYDAHPNEYAHVLATDAIDKFLKANIRDPTKSGQRDSR